MSKEDRFQKIRAGELPVPENYDELVEFQNWNDKQNSHKPIGKIEKINFPSDVLEDTFFGDYERTYSGRNETCPSFRFAELLTSIGCLLGRSIMLQGMAMPLYPNWYICLIGDPYFSKKSSSIYRTQKLLETDVSIEQFDTLSSPEGFLDALSDKSPRALIMYDELKSLFIKARMSGTEGLIPMLTRAWACPDILQNNTKSDRIEVENPAVSLLGGITPQWLQSGVSRDDIGGGFISRVVFFQHEQMPYKSIVGKPDTNILDGIKAVLSGIRAETQERMFEFDNESVDAYDNWYHSINDGLQNVDPVIRLASARVIVHAQKMALILAYLKNGRADNKVHIEEWEIARSVGEYWRAVNLSIFSDFAADEATADEMRVIKHLKELGGQASKGELGSKIGYQNLAARDLAKILEAMVINERIHIETTGRSSRIILLAEN